MAKGENGGGRLGGREATRPDMNMYLDDTRAAMNGSYVDGRIPIPIALTSIQRPPPHRSQNFVCNAATNIPEKNFQT